MVVTDTVNVLKTVVEVFVVAELHVDTAAYRHPEVAGAAGADEDAVNEAAVISSLPVVVAEVLYVAVEVAEGAPDPIKTQGHFQVVVVLLVCGYQNHQEQGL